MYSQEELRGIPHERLIYLLTKEAIEVGPTAQDLVIDPMSGACAKTIEQLKEELLRRLKPPEPPEIQITKHRAGIDPAISVFHVVLTHGGGSWSETWGSKEQLEAFIKGITAGCGMLNVYLPAPGIPTETSEE